MFIETQISMSGSSTPISIKVKSIECYYRDIQNGHPDRTLISTLRNSWVCDESYDVIHRKVLAALPLTTEINPDEI